MATGVEELLDMLFEMIDEAKSMPLSSDKCILERDKALDLLDEIRAQFPHGAGRGQEAHRCPDGVYRLRQAGGGAHPQAGGGEGTPDGVGGRAAAQTKQKANELMRTAEERSRDLRKAANDYCEDALRRTEEAVAEAYDEIKKSRARFRALAGGGAPAGRQPYDVEAE